jgi:hypothetical protein
VGGALLSFSGIPPWSEQQLDQASKEKFFKEEPQGNGQQKGS